MSNERWRLKQIIKSGGIITTNQCVWLIEEIEKFKRNCHEWSGMDREIAQEVQGMRRAADTFIFLIETAIRKSRIEQKGIQGDDIERDDTDPNRDEDLGL